MEKELLVNQMQTPDGTMLISSSRHDCVTHIDKNGEMYINDGGEDYIRRSINKEPAIDKCLYTDSPFEDVRNSMTRITADGKKILLKDMTIQHLFNCILYGAKENCPIGKYRWQYIRELAYRYEHNLI